MFLTNNTCVSASSCPFGSFPNTTSFLCQTCSIQCKSCANLSNCISCNSGYYFVNSTNQCMSICPNGSIADNSSQSCLTCSHPCANCINSITACLTCASNYVLFTSNSTCLSNCPTGYLANLSSICQLCSYNCTACSISLSNCTSCLSNLYYLISNSALGSCYSNCPSGYFNNNSSSIYVCSVCINNCSTCSDSNTCLSCLPPLILDGSSCSLTCPLAQYNYKNVCMTCQQAITSCLTCNSSLTSPICLGCSSNLILFQGQCLSSCPNNYYYDSVSSTCVYNGNN